MLDVDQLLRQAVERGASDVHIKVGSPPYIRVDGTKVWSLMQLERRLRPEVYGRVRGGYVTRRRGPAGDHRPPQMDESSSGRMEGATEGVMPNDAA